jgi:hypothetical protein
LVDDFDEIIHELIRFRLARAEVETKIASEGEAAARPDANFLVRRAAEIAAELCGPEILGISLLTSRPEADPLYIMAHRLNLAEPLIGAGGDDHFVDLRNEIYSVVAGDGPNLFRKRSKKKGKGEDSKYRAINHWLEALRWEAFLSGLGVKASERQARFASAYCVTHDSLRTTWKRACLEMWGPEHVNAVIAAAKKAGEDAKAAGRVCPETPFKAPTFEMAGQLYRDEMRAPEDKWPFAPAD